MVVESLTQSWRPQLMHLLSPIARRIVSLNVYRGTKGSKVILHFTNGYGIEIIKSPDEDFLKMIVIRFVGTAYEFAFDIPIPDLNLGYTDLDILKLCKDVSLLKKDESKSRIHSFEVMGEPIPPDIDSRWMKEMNQLRQLS